MPSTAILQTRNMTPMTEEDWYQERLTTYFRIFHSVKEVQAHLRKAEAAINALKKRYRDRYSKRIAIDVADYNSAHAKDVPIDDGSIKNVQQAEKVFEENKKQAKEIFEFLWRQGNEDDLEVLRGVDALEVARRDVKKIIEEDIPMWEKWMSDIAEVGRMLTA